MIAADDRRWDTHRLESVGRLAGGVAHEINTPMQFVSDSLHFVGDAVADLMALGRQYRTVVDSVLAGAPSVDAASQARTAEAGLDLAYLEEHLPKALARALDGLQRVTAIVASMTALSEPEQHGMTMVDVNQAIQSALTIARNEYKYVADIELDLANLPMVICHRADVSHAALNIIVNAAHAISDVVAGTDHRGLITVRSSHEGDSVCISIGDTGGGVPENLRHRVFEPSFTTRPAGTGAGQGLAIAHSLVAERHGGSLTFDTECGRGTTFHIRLPVDGPLHPENSGAAA